MAEWMDTTQHCLAPTCHPHWPLFDSSCLPCSGVPLALCTCWCLAWETSSSLLHCWHLFFPTVSALQVSPPQESCLWPALPRGQILQLQAYTIYCALFALLHFTEVAFFFLQTEGMTFHQQKDYDSLYSDNHLIAGVWNGTHRIFEACLCRCS